MRSIVWIAIVGVALAAGGCMQAPRHTNTLMFATNTSGGIKLGVDEQQVPHILIGYERHEAVFMPLVANTNGEPDGLKPCPTQGSGSATALPDTCVLRGTGGEGEADADAYSVLATFRGNATAKSGEGQAQAGGAIAQYFATGLAARALAEAGGAAAIATGDAAKSSALSTGAKAEKATFERRIASDLDAIRAYFGREADGNYDAAVAQTLFESANVNPDFLNDFQEEKLDAFLAYLNAELPSRIDDLAKAARTSD